MMTKQMISKAVLALLLITSMVACKNSPSPEEATKAEAMAVAQACYDRLLEGDYDGFLAFRHDIDKIPEEMRPQLADAYKMYMATEEQLHKGVKKFTAVRAEMDSTMQMMHVFMQLDYGDGTQEEVVVPMVPDGNGQWRMK
ncbi:MAG: hypothetical protein IKH32_09220 [Prevotella sp.]|nr:hypothetical protein [Prevotella sp.]